MSYGGIKDLSRRSASDKVLREKAFDDAKNKKNMMYINVDLLQSSITFLIKGLPLLTQKQEVILIHILKAVGWRIAQLIIKKLKAQSLFFL